MKVFATIALFLGAVSARVAVSAEATTTITLPPAATETRVSWTPETEHNSTVSSSGDKPTWRLEMFEGKKPQCGDNTWMTVTLNQFGTFCFQTVIDIRRMQLVNMGGCATTFFSDEHCTNNPNQINQRATCVGYNTNDLIKSVVVAC
ncbi:hypothetical protein QBC41DRAFT_397101 [Cercophora samala]|uniref:Uncharacterized protein n=1 Tax=Cercophora samala TaxID=330535 RepID=A0AA39ZL83_9PEZI|nr:hypothetical protein QBC41DRAFT_397101 [Cercophora samala]